MNIIKLFNASTFQKAELCGCTGKSIFSGFIPTMQFLEKQHNSTLKALFLMCKNILFNLLFSPKNIIVACFGVGFKFILSKAGSLDAYYM